MRVLLTGGYGCIGSWIVRTLLERGDQVCIYDLKQDTHRLEVIMTAEQIRHVDFVAGDVVDQPRLFEAMKSHAISHVIHLAGLQVPVCRAKPILGATVNVVGTLSVFEAVRQLPDQVKRLVYASSASVFGPSDTYADGKLGDDVHLKPTSHYGVFKLCNEGNAKVYFQENGLSSVGLRPWTVYGVGRDFGMTSEPTKAIKSLALGRAYHITYGGVQDLQYVEDVARIFVRCLEAPYQGAKSYNLRGQVVDLPTFHAALVAADPAARELITYGDRQLSIAFDLDDSALQRDLGPMPLTPLVDGVRQVLTDFRRLAAEGRLDTADLGG